jgi:hypothetical protein
MKVTSFEEACACLNIDPATAIPNVSGFPESDQKSLIAYAKLIIIAKAINDSAVLDFGNWSQEKWFPVFYKPENSSGFRFDVTCYCYSGTSTAGGSRLCYTTRDLAKYAAETFKSLYEDLMN